MKWMPLAVALTMATCALVFAQSKVSTSQSGANVEQMILGIEKEMLNGVLKGDASVFQRYLADTYVFTAPDGMVSGKAQSIADIKSGALKLQAASLDNPKVQVYGDTAVVTYGSTDKGTYKGKDISGKTRWTDVFVRRNGQWQLVAGHGSRVLQ